MKHPPFPCRGLIFAVRNHPRTHVTVRRAWWRRRGAGPWRLARVELRDGTTWAVASVERGIVASVAAVRGVVLVFAGRVA